MIFVATAADVPSATGIYDLAYRDIHAVFLNFESLREAEFLAMIETAKPFIRRPDHLGKLVTLTNVAEAAYNKRTADAISLFVGENAPYVVARAVYGLTGLRRAFVGFLSARPNSNLKAFEEPMTALEWLVEEHEKRVPKFDGDATIRTWLPELPIR